MSFGIDFGESPDDRVLADINVTPLVDVMLVLQKAVAAGMEEKSREFEQAGKEVYNKV